MQLSYIFKKRARKIRGVYVYGLYTIYSSWCWIGSDLGLQEHAVRMVRCRRQDAQGTSVFVEAGRNVMISSEGLVEMHIPKLLTQVLQNQKVARTITPLYWIRFLTFQHFFSKGFDIST